jgi:ketohexokinase
MLIPCSTIGAGDTFIAGMLYGLIWRSDDWDMVRKLAFANEIASRKVCREGFGGLGDTMRKYGFNPP